MPILDDSEENRGFYSCRNCKRLILFGISKCGYCGWFNFSAGREERAKVEFQRQLVFIAIREAKKPKPITQYVSLCKPFTDTLYRIIGLTNGKKILTVIRDKESELWNSI